MSSPAVNPNTDQTIVPMQDPANPPAAPAPQPPSAPSTPGVFGRILQGALAGLAQGGVAGAINGGVESTSPTQFQKIEVAQQQRQDLNAAKVAQEQGAVQAQQSNIKFQTAQAANAVAEAARNNAIAANLPTQAKDAHDAAQLQMAEQLQQLGITPTVIADDTHDAATSALEGLTNTQGAVPHLFNLEVGGQHLAYDLNQLSGTPQGLTVINNARQAQGQDPISQAAWRQQPKAAQAQVAENALKFWAPPPTTSASQANGLYLQYKSFADAYAKNPNADPQVTDRLNKLVSNLKGQKDGQLGQEKDIAQTKANIASQSALETAAGKQDIKNANTPDWRPGVTADEKKKTELAENIADNANQAASIIQRRPDLLGAVAGRYTSAQQMIGSNDKDIAALGTTIHNIAMANSGVHGFRSQEGVVGTERTILNNFRNGPQAVGGALKALTNSTQTFVDNARPEGYKTHSKQGGALKGMIQ